MVKHIVLFKLKDEVSAEEKLVVMNKFKEAIEALPAKIPVIRKVEVGLNMNPGETWNIALYSEFDTLEDVKFYATHPDSLTFYPISHFIWLKQQHNQTSRKIL